MNRLGTLALMAFVAPVCAHADPCPPTPHRTTGTHYKPVTEHKLHVSSGLRVRGRILSAPDCKPVAHAKVAHWQADEAGVYVDRLRAYLFTDQDGRYEFTTEWPNLVTPHIHFIVTADGHAPLETQWVGQQRSDRIDFDMVLRKQ